MLPIGHAEDNYFTVDRLYAYGHGDSRLSPWWKRTLPSAETLVERGTFLIATSGGSGTHEPNLVLRRILVTGAIQPYSLVDLNARQISTSMIRFMVWN